MIIAYMSDLHLQTRDRDNNKNWTSILPLGWGPCLYEYKHKQIEVMIIAGDIGRLMPEQDDVCALTYCKQVADFLNCKVVFIPGNHEYYGKEFSTARKWMFENNKNKSFPNVYALDRKEYIYKSEDLTKKSFSKTIRFLGTTLWTDYQASGDRTKAIQLAEKSFSKRIMWNKNECFFPKYQVKEHDLSLKWLEKKLLKPFDGPTIIVSHHVPHTSLRNQTFPVNHSLTSFCSDLDHLIKQASDKNTCAWIFGHHHLCMKEKIYDINMLSAQWGYKDETKWKGIQIFNL